MNLKDLSQFKLEDLKNIDYLELKDQILSRPDLLINAGLVIVTLIISLAAYNGYRKENVEIGNQIKETKAKLEALKEREGLQKEYQDMMKNAPQQLTVEGLGDKISQYARAHDINIVLFDPKKPKDYEYIYGTELHLRLSAVNYKDLVLFLKDIESGMFSYRIRNFSASYQAGLMRMNDNEGNAASQPQINIDLTIESVENKEVETKQAPGEAEAINPALLGDDNDENK